MEPVSVSVPRGMQLQAGQDVFVVEGDGALVMFRESMPEGCDCMVVPLVS